MGNLFHRNVSTEVMKEMDFHELKYWNEWHEVINQAHKDEIDNA